MIRFFLNLQDFHGAVDAFAVKQVDTTGAGDAFIGAMLSKLVEDQSVLQVSDKKFENYTVFN